MCRESIGVELQTVRRGLVRFGIEAMPRRFKLSFLPLADENYDLLIDRKSYFTEPVQMLIAFARTPEFLDKSETLGGYDLANLGTVRWLSD